MACAAIGQAVWGQTPKDGAAEAAALWARKVRSGRQ